MRRLLGAVLAALAAGAAVAQDVELTRPQARALAERAVLAGDAGLARDLAEGLIAADAEDRDAWLVLAAAAVAEGRPAEARAAGARAWRLSDSGPERYEAARVTALAARNEGRAFLAGFWLRAALLSAPDAEEEARTRRDAEALRDANPWRVDVGLAFAPSDNVNGGSEGAFNVIDGLPFVGRISVDGRALSGWTGTLDLNVSRRLWEGPRARTVLGFRLYQRSVVLSEESRDLIEEETGLEDAFTGADLASATTELSLGHDRVAGPGVVFGNAALGLTSYGGERSLGTLRLSAGGRMPVGARQELRFSGFAERRRDLDDPAAGRTDDRRLGATLGWRGRAGRAADLSLTLGRAETFSDNRNADASTWSVRAGAAPLRAVGPARLALTLGAEVTEYPDYAVFFPVPGGRRDERVSATLEATFTGWDVAGFVPVVSLEAGRTFSNVSRFEREGVGLGFAVRSSF